MFEPQHTPIQAIWLTGSAHRQDPSAGHAARTAPPIQALGAFIKRLFARPGKAQAPACAAPAHACCCPAQPCR